MQQDAVNFESEMDSYLGEKMREFQLANPSVDTTSPDFLKQYDGWYKDGIKSIRRSVYQEALADLRDAKVPGIFARERDEQGNLVSTRSTKDGPVDDSESDLFGELYAEPGSPADDFATIRQNLYQMGEELPYYEDWIKDRPGKMMSAAIGFTVKATRGFEGSAQGIGKYVGRKAVGWTMDNDSIAKSMGVDPKRLQDIIMRKTVAAGSAPSQPISPQFDMGIAPPEETEDDRIYRQFMDIRDAIYEENAKEEGDAWMRGARYVSEVTTPESYDRFRMFAAGADPTNPQDIRDRIGGQRTGALVKTAEMLGSAVGVLPYSIPALLTRNPKIAAALTAPFYAMGHSSAWDRRMEIYRDQLAEARALGLPEPARPSLQSLELQSAVAGTGEYVSEYTFDRFQRVLPELMSWGGMGAPKVAKDSARYLSKYGRELAQSLSRRNGLIGAAKVPAVAAIGGVTEGLEEALPEALKEVTDPLFIPEGYENDFFSEETAEAVGTGFIAGMLTTGGMMAAKSVPFVGEKAKRRRLAKRAAPLIVGAIQDKANRLATDRLVQNAAEARGPTMALHQIDEMAAGVRGAMFVSGDNAETTLTDDVRQRMKGAGITEKPIGMVGGMRVYAPVSMVAEVRDAIKSGDTKKLTGHPLLKDPSLPAVGALVVTNKANQIVEVIPYSSSAEAEAHAASLAHDSRLAGTTVKNVGADGLATISETIDLQVEADSTVRNLTPQQRRAGSTRKEARGILSLRGSIMQDALGSKMGRRPSEDFSSPYLNNAETQGAKNRDVEVDVILKKVDESALDENERKIALTTGVTPTILDGVVRFKIKRADGSTATIEKPFAQAGAYLGQENPDGVFLLRENGSAFTFRNALAILMHELRHKLVGTRAGAEFLTKLLYLDPEFALRGGLQYMRENARESTVERGADGSLRHLTEEELVGRYAAMHFAAEAVLSDTAGSTKRERQEAQEARATVEQFAEESLATAMEGSTGFTFAMAAEWETILKHTQDRNMRKFLGWTAAKLTEAGFAGPWAKQALYEIRQRSQGIRDQQLRVNQQMFSELAEQYKGDVKTYEEAKSGSSSAAAIAATGLATPLAALGGGEDEDKIEGAAKALADLKSAPEDQRAALASAAISALASILPTLASASASVSGVGTGGGSTQAGKTKRPADMPPRPEPAEIAARTAGQASEVPSDQPMTEQGMVPLEREMLQEGGERVSPLMAMRPSAPLEFFSALQRGIGAIEEEKLSAPAWRQRIKGLVNKGEVKQDEVDWSGLDDFLALPREGKLTKKEITGFIDSSGVQVTEGKQFDWSDNEIRLREATRRGLESWREAAAAAGIRIPAQIKRDVDLLVNRQGPWTAEVSAATGRIAEWSEEHDLDHPESFIEYEDDRLLDEPALNQFEDYTLPGGTNYRETVLTIPSERLSSNPDVAVFSSIHWPEIDNPVAHIRSKDRQGQDDAKVLFVEEIQSDWAQRGRRIGFKSSDSMSMDREQTQFEEQEKQTRDDARKAFSQINNMGFASWLGAREVLRNNPDWRSKPNEFDMRPLTEAQLNSIESNVDAYRKEREIGDRRAAESKKIPRAPFVENTEGWLNLSLKRVIMDAVNGGYDRVAFVSGKQSADRYDLTKKLRGIEYTKHPDGYEVKAWTVDGSGYERLGMPTRISEDRLEDYIGKELAEKIVAGQGTQYKDRPETRSLDARDMQLTGKGMVDFYDKIVPAAVNKLLKKLGGGKATIVDAGTGEQQIGFDVTDEMRTKLQESGGMPMFAMRKAAASLENSMKVAMRQKWQNQREFKLEIQRQVRDDAKRKGIDLSGKTKESVKHLIEVGVEDAKQALKENANAVGWYDVKTRVALGIMSLVHPELAYDENARFAFVYALAVTSNGMKVGRNFIVANNVYSEYKKTGLMPTNIGEGKSGKAVNESLSRFNQLKAKFGEENFRKFMLTDFTVEQIDRLGNGLKAGGENADTVVRGASILGPKIGNGFFSNLYGKFDALTMDRWLVRTWGRWRGDLVNVSPKAVQEARARLDSAIAGLSAAEKATAESIIGKRLSTRTDFVDRAAYKFTKDDVRKKFASPAMDELRRSVNRLAETMDGQKELPDDGYERERIRLVFSGILSALRQDKKYADLTMADLQAVLWYAEKRLYEQTKTVDKKAGYEDSEAPDYANAARETALASKIPQDRIDEVERIEQDGRAGTTRRGDAVEQVDAELRRIPGSEGFTKEQRRRWAGSIIAARAYSERIAGDSNWTYRGRQGSTRTARRDRLLKGLGRVGVVSVWSPGMMLERAYSAHGFPIPEFLELAGDARSAKAFVKALEASKASNGPFGAAVYVYGNSEYEGMRMFLSDDGMAGFAIKPDGDIVSVFNTTTKDSNGERVTRGRAAMEVAVSAGGLKLDCFDTMLPSFYGAHGFVVASRIRWDETQAPAGWDKGPKAFGKYNNGEPDVVFMVKTNDRIQMGHAGEVARDYGHAVELQSKAMREIDDKTFKPNGPIPAMFSMRRGAVGIRDEAFLRYVDKYDELLRYTRIAAQRGVNMAGLGNPYIGARLLQGRLGAMQRASERRYAALLRRMHDAGVTLEEMDEFLTAQHAEERNNYVATINPAFPDGGSGMTTGDANNILQAHQLSGRFAMLDGFANEWRQMLNESLVQRRDAGLITQQLYDTLTTRYQRYVPLRGAPVQPNDEDFDAWGEGGGSGLSTSGRGMPRALGRQSEALSVTSQVAYVHEDAFRRIARNEIGQSFLNLVMAVGDRNMAEVIRPRRRVLAGGTVRQVHDMGWMQDQRNFGLYVNAPTVINGHTYEPGDLVVIRINNRRLADAMTTPTLELRAFERALGNVNNAWRFMTTGMGNPAFAPVNMIRDVGQATLNNLARRGFIDTAQMLMRYPRAFMRVWADNWINTQPSETAIAGRDRNMVGTYARFVAAGGDMVAWRGNDLEAKRTDFEALADRVARRDPADRGVARTLLGWYSGFFAATETAARLAQFEQRVASGESDSDAALAARDITVDFAKGGLAKPVLNTWYMFLNAGLQGTVNLAGALARSVTLAPALMMLGYAQAAIARSMGGDDEETQQSNWDNVPEYEKTGNMYFFKPDRSGKHIKVPVPYGYNVFFSAGVRLEDAVNGRGTPSDMMAGMLVDSLNAFNPIGGSGIKGGTGGVLSSVLPTMIRPLSEVALNEDFAGRRIYPQQYGKFPAPDSSLAFDGTPEAYFATAEWMNEVTGGDEFEPGLVDVSPNALEYLVGYYFSGTGRMLNRLYKATLSNEDVTVNDIPIMRSFVGNAANDNRAISQQYNEIAADLAPDMRRADVIMSDSATPEQRRRAFAGIDQRKGRLIETLEQTDKALSEIRKMLKGAEGDDRKDLLEARRNVQKALIRRKNQLTDELATLE